MDDDIEEEISELVSQEIDDIEEYIYKEWNWAYDGILYDWLDNNGKQLTEYKPPDITFTYYL